MKIKLLKLIDASLGRLLCLSFGYLDHLFNFSPKDVKIPQTINKVLVIRPGGLGDFIYLLPALAVLKKKYPKAKLHVLAEKRNRLVSLLTNIIDAVFAYDSRPFSTLLALRKEKYELVIDSEQFHNFSALFAYITGAKVRVGFKTNPWRNHLYTHLINYSLVGQEAFEFLNLLAPLQLKVDQIDFNSVIDFGKIERTALPSQAADFYHKFTRVVIVAPRAQAKYRHWDAKKYAAVIDYLTSQPKTGVILLGGQLERKFAHKIWNIINQNQVLPLIAKTSFLELAYILRKCSLFVGCDSGVAILAAALGAKTITIFGSADEKKWGLGQKNNHIVRLALPCSPCQVLGNYKFCKKIDCLEKISAQDIIKKIQALGFQT